MSLNQKNPTEKRKTKSNEELTRKETKKYAPRPKLSQYITGPSVPVFQNYEFLGDLSHGFLKDVRTETHRYRDALIHYRTIAHSTP